MADWVNFKKVLGISDHQALEEIKTMRVFDKVVRQHVSEEEYLKISLEVARLRMEEEMREAGLSEEEVSELCDLTDASFANEPTEKPGDGFSEEEKNT